MQCRLLHHASIELNRCSGSDLRSKQSITSPLPPEFTHFGEVFGDVVTVAVAASPCG
jgi:hypothetical protein